MPEYVQVWHATVAEGAVERLLEVRPAAIAEAMRLCPELVSADLVDVGGGVWLDVLRWTCPDGEERLMAKAAEFGVLDEMHGLFEVATPVGRGAVAVRS